MIAQYRLRMRCLVCAAPLAYHGRGGCTYDHRGQDCPCESLAPPGEDSPAGWSGAWSGGEFPVLLGNLVNIGGLLTLLDVDRRTRAARRPGVVVSLPAAWAGWALPQPKVLP